MSAVPRHTRSPQPGDMVAIVNHPDVVDGAQAIVLGVNGRWIALHLLASGANLIAHVDQVCMVHEEEQ